MRIPNPADMRPAGLEPARGIAQINENVAGRIGQAGRQMGNAIEAIGAAFGDVAMRQAQTEDATNLARAKLEWYKFDNEAWTGLQNSASEDGTGWERTPEVYEKGRQDIISRFPINDPRRREELNLYFEHQIASRGFQAARQKQSQAGTYYRGIEDKEIDGAVARIEANPSQETVDAMRGPLGELVESGRGIYHSEATIEKRKREIEGRLLMGQYRGLIKQDPEAAAELFKRIQEGNYEIDQPRPIGPRGALNEVDRTSTGLRNLGGIKPEGIVFHHTSGTTVDGAIDTLAKRGLSYNYLIDKDGTVHTIVPPEKGAQHMRPGSNGMSSGNTIGISFVARNDRDVTDEQRQAARSLAARDAARFGISQEKVFGHGEVNSHKEHDEGKTDAEWIRKNGFGGGAPQLISGPEPVERPAKAEGEQQPAPMAERSLTRYAGLKTDAASDAVIIGETPAKGQGEPANDNLGIQDVITELRGIAKDAPRLPLTEAIDRETLIGLADQYPEIASIEDFDNATVGDALKAIDALSGNKRTLPPRADNMTPMGRLVGGQTFTVKSKVGDITVSAESLNALDRGMLRKLQSEAREMSVIRQREGEAIADDMIRKQLLTLEQTGKGHSEFDQKLLAEVYRKNPKKVAEFERRSQIATQVYEATADSVNIPNDVLEERLDRLRASIVDGSGDADPAAQAAFDRAEKRIKSLMSVRDKDPARAVRDSKEVAAVRAQIPDGEPKNKAHLFQMADATIKAQTRLGLPIVPITKAEARTIMSDIIYAPENQKRAVALETAKRVNETYGSLAQQVMAAATKMASGDTRDDDDYLGSAMKRIQRQSTVKDVDAAVGASSGKKQDRLPSAPNYFDKFDKVR